MERIKLGRSEWMFDPECPLGRPGGFGTVYRGTDAEGQAVAVKRLHSDAGEHAHREFKMAEALMDRSLKHVLPFLDAGLDARSDRYFLVMPRAERSLQERLQTNETLDAPEVVQILNEILLGLEELPGIVHRDLKPGNILWIDGVWRIADFGIARFVETSTSLRTLKGCLSPPYAAPEQWKLEQSTHATDLYALGCIMHALTTGWPPFQGSDEELRKSHLSATPPDLESSNPLLRSLATSLLMKAPDARPSAARVRRILDQLMEEERAGTGATTGRSLLAQAGARAATAANAAASRAEQARIANQQRSELARSAFQVIDGLADGLSARIQLEAPTASCTRSPAHFLEAHLAGGDIEIFLLQDQSSMLPEDAFRSSEWDVIMGAGVAVWQKGHRPYRWEANLWFADIEGTGKYRWWEVAYMSLICERRDRNAPFAVERRELELADEAAASGMSEIQFAYDPVPSDGEDAAAFFERWCILLALACEGRLRRPSYLPISDLGEYLKQMTV